MLPNYLANIKSSGIYRFVFDKSQMPVQEAQTLRLVVGYSEKGPFNTPVYVTNPDNFVKIFGGKSKKMERYGMWFHRLALQALKAGPILAFNIKNFEGAGDGKNEVEYTTFNPDESIFNTTTIDGETMETKLRMAVKDLYNTDRFWTLEPEHLEDYLQNKEDEMTKAGKTFKKGYITITTTDSKETSVTVFMRGYEPKGYDVPFSEWYSSVLNGEEVPAYLEGHERDYVSQYFAEMFIFKGEFTPEIAASDKLAKFFNVDGTKVTLKPYIVNSFGDKIDTLNALASNDASNFIASYSGILLPDFRNANNTVISLDAQVNADNYVHKLMMRLNQDMLYSIDPEDTDGFQISDIDTTGWSKGPEFTGAMMSLEKVEPIIFEASFVDGEWKYNQGEHEGEEPDYFHYNDLTPTAGSDDYTWIFNDEDNRFGNCGIHEGDSIFAGTLAHVVSIKDKGNPGYNFTSYGDATGTEVYGEGKVEVLEDTGSVAHVIVRENYEESFVGQEFYVASDTNTMFLELFTDAELTTSANIWVKLGDEITYNTYTVQVDKTTEDGIDMSNIYKCVGSISATSAYIRPLYLKGYTYGNPKPASTKQLDKLNWQTYMMGALKEYRGLRIALTSRVDVEYRYLIDTFEGFVQNECKSILSLICKEKDNAFAILNFPQMKNFSKCDYTSFRGENGEFDTRYIPMGGNPLKPMGVMFSLPSQENGASWCGFFSCVKIQDPDTRVKEDVPSAALVSNNFMKKYTTYQPYTIIAGTNRGVLSENGLIGPDFNFWRGDLDNLEPFGVNCMVYVDRKGTCINSNQTAKQNPVTTLSRINVRELVIFLQDEIEKMMLDYHWDFNTPNLRQRIEDRANVILETAKNNGGVYVYHNQCDSQNNTDDVINSEMLVLSTSIEPGMGAGKMVQELYIYRKGGMSSVLLSDTGA